MQNDGCLHPLLFKGNWPSQASLVNQFWEGRVAESQSAETLQNILTAILIAHL